MPDLEKFSEDVALWNYQQDAIRAVTKTLYLAFAEGMKRGEAVPDFDKLESLYQAQTSTKEYKRIFDIPKENKRYRFFRDYHKPADHNKEWFDGKYFLIRRLLNPNRNVVNPLLRLICPLAIAALPFRGTISPSWKSF